MFTPLSYYIPQLLSPSPTPLKMIQTKIAGSMRSRNIIGKIKSFLGYTFSPLPKDPRFLDRYFYIHSEMTGWQQENITKACVHLCCRTSPSLYIKWPSSSSCTLDCLPPWLRFYTRVVTATQQQQQCSKSVGCVCVRGQECGADRGRCSIGMPQIRTVAAIQ